MGTDKHGNNLIRQNFKCHQFSFSTGKSHFSAANDIPSFESPNFVSIWWLAYDSIYSVTNILCRNGTPNVCSFVAQLDKNRRVHFLSAFIRVHLCSSCQNPYKQRVSCARGRPLSAELSVLRRMQTLFATIRQYPAETRPLHLNVSRRFCCMMQTHAHENKIHPVPAR